MFRQRRQHALLLVAALLLAGLTWAGMGLRPSSARAYHTYEERLLDTTALGVADHGVALGGDRLAGDVGGVVPVDRTRIGVAGHALEHGSELGEGRAQVAHVERVLRLALVVRILGCEAEGDVAHGSCLPVVGRSCRPREPA